MAKKSASLMSPKRNEWDGNGLGGVTLSREEAKLAQEGVNLCHIALAKAKSIKGEEMTPRAKEQLAEIIVALDTATWRFKGQ